jgi:hypothetical protein
MPDLAVAISPPHLHSRRERRQTAAAHSAASRYDIGELALRQPRANLQGMIHTSKLIVVTISHQLGRDEAKRRLAGGLDQVRKTLAPFASAIDYRWVGYRLDFGLTALQQSVTGHIQVEEDILRIEFHLPLLLQLLSGKIIDRIASEAPRLLGKPDD